MYSVLDKHHSSKDLLYESAFTQNSHFLSKPLNGSSFQPSKVILTRREVEVLILLAEGLTTLKIAEKLFISKHTVNSHRSNLMSKLQAKNIAKLICQGFRFGFLR